jgi:hypothetical protein
MHDPNLQLSAFNSYYGSVATTPDRLVLLGIAHDEVEANIWRDVLAHEGIGVFVKAFDPLASFGALPRVNSLRVFVEAGNERRARWLLGDGTAAEA